MSVSGLLPARVACIAGAAWLLLATGCAGPLPDTTPSPPGVEVPEPGVSAGRQSSASAAAAPHAAAGTRPASAAPSTARVYAAPSASVYPAQSSAGAPESATRSAGDGFSIEASRPAGTPPPAAVPPAEAIAVQAPPPSTNSAVNTLLAQAATERRGGNIEAAIAAAERALRIAPADPAVYCELATLRLEHGDYAQAEQLARKGLSYQPDAELQERLNAIVERARRGSTG